MYVADASAIPSNLGVNPSLTITALAEYAMSRMPPKKGADVRQPLGVTQALHDQHAVPVASQPIQEA